MKKVIILLISISFFGTHNTLAQSKKELKKQQQQEAYQVTKKLIESGKFVFEADWATSQRGRRINLSGDGYTLKINAKSSTAYFPFFGRAHSATYGGSGGIEFANLNTQFDIEYDDKKTKIILKFQANHKSENFDIYLSIFGNGNATLRISSSSRDSMSYDGKIQEIPPEKED